MLWCYSAVTVWQVWWASYIFRVADPLARTEDIHESTLRVMAIQRQIKLLNLRVALAAEKRHAAKMQAELLQLRIQQLELDSEQTSLLS